MSYPRKPPSITLLLFDAAAHDFMDEGKFVKQNPLAGLEHFDNLLVSTSLNEQVPT